MADVVETHGGRRDVGFERGRSDAPFRVAHPEELFVVREALDERVETQLSPPGAQSGMMAALGTIIISTQRSSS
jgi:hypothetical protein